MNYDTYKNLIFVWMALGAFFFMFLLNVTAPYGRHTSSKWGPLINNKIGWGIMEAPGMILLLYFLLANASKQNAMSWALAAFYLFHYINRTFIFPFRLRTRSKKMPLVIVASAIFFNLANGYFLGYYFARFNQYTPHELVGARFVIGAVIFLLGVYINWNYDNKLIHLRKPGETGYKLPRGSLFKYVSCPNHLGEIIEWTGYAIMCWNLPALSFLVWTMANLIPRSLSHHRWYRKNFADYPAKRKAVVPRIL